MRLKKITKLFDKNTYKKFDLDTIKVGDIILYDIFIKRSDQFIIIIEAKTLLTDQLYKTLKKQDALYMLEETINSVEDEDEDDDFLNYLDDYENTLLESITQDKEDLEKTLNLLYDESNKLFNDFLNNKEDKIDLHTVKSIVESTIFLIKNHNQYLKKIMPKLRNDYHLPTHSFNVSLYSLHIGHYLNLNNEELLKLGQAGLLLDTGKKYIDYIINKNDELNEEEIEQTKKHIEYSLNVLKDNMIDDLEIIDAVKHHHERYDGSGYPSKLKKNEMSELASILAVCDVFDALTIDKPNRKKYTTFESLKMMMKDPSMKNKFNDEYIKLLLV